MKIKILLFFTLASFFFQPCQLIAVERLKVVVTTTHLGEMVKAIAKDNVELVTLIPGGSCPGHFDIDPATVKKIATADIFICQVWEKRFDSVLDGINNKKLQRKYALTQGNWMVPEVNIKASREITEIISGISEDKKQVYEKNLKDYIQSVQLDMQRILSGSKKLKGQKVVCAKHQEDFLKWLGLDVIASYERAEDLNILNMAEVIKKAKKENAVLVVDNLQSGANTGLQIAKDLKIAHITLTNFPQSGSYLNALNENLQKILKAVEKRGYPRNIK